MFLSMAPTTLERLMDESPAAAVEQQRAVEAHAAAVQITHSLVAAYGPDCAERIGRELARLLARELEIVRPDDVSGGRLGGLAS